MLEFFYTVIMTLQKNKFMQKKTVECNVNVTDTSAEGVTPILVVVEGTDKKETSEDDVS